jgi:hypothetical protein
VKAILSFPFFGIFGAVPSGVSLERIDRDSPLKQREGGEWSVTDAV